MAERLDGPLPLLDVLALHVLERHGLTPSPPRGVDGRDDVMRYWVEGRTIIPDQRNELI
jgi:hypothetical protein